MGIHIMTAVTSITEAPKMFGAYVSNISSSIGWGGQGGSCQMTLVEDPANDVVITLPEVGTACYFRFEKFYFGGVLQRHMYKESTSGRTYDITLESPSKILDGLQVILGGFEGTAFNLGSGYDSFKPYKNPTFTNELNNIYNPFGHEENRSVGRLRDPVRDAHFGKADINSVGFPAVRLLELIELISQGPDEDGIVASEFGGKAKFGESEYTIDLTELIDLIKDKIPNFRVGGNVKNLNGILADCTDIIQYDYFVTVTGIEPQNVEEVDPDSGQIFVTRRNMLQTRRGESVDGTTIAGGFVDLANGGGILENPVITIKTVSKAEQPEPNWIKNQIATYKDDMLVSSETGKELSDSVTQRLVVGGAASRYYTAKASTFLPIWGKRGNQDGYHIEFTSATRAYGDPYHKVPIHTIPSGVSQEYFGTSQYYATIFELRMAISGIYTWRLFKTLELMKEQNDWRNAPFQAMGFGRNVNNIQQAMNFISTIANGTRGALLAINTGAVNSTFGNLDGQTEEWIFNQVLGVATKFWGCMFLVPLPEEPGGIDNNFRWISDEGKGNAEAAWDIVDSAWAEPAPIDDLSFYDGSGRLKAVSTWKYKGYKHDYSQLGADWAFTVGTSEQQIATTKAKIEKDIYWVKDLVGEIHPYAVCTCPQIRAWDEHTTTNDAWGRGGSAQGLTYIINHVFQPYPEWTTAMGIADINYDIVMPAFFGIPQQSNQYKWGPWYRYGALNGKAEVVSDESLKPETFGKQSIMDEAAFAIAYAGVARMTASETGYVELAEYPAFNIAERFGNSGPYVTNLDISIGTGGVKTTYKFNTWTPNFGKLAKYNIDRISRINKANLSFEQKERGLWQKSQMARPEPLRLGVGDILGNSAMPGVPGPFGNFAHSLMSAAMMRTFGNLHPQGGNVGLDQFKLAAESDFEHTYGMTDDQFRSPITVYQNPTDSNTGPGFEKPASGNDEVGNFGDNQVGPTQNELNPYFSSILGDTSEWINKVDFCTAMHGTAMEEAEELSFEKMEEAKRKALESVRPLALRGPIMLSGWGFDIAERAVPAKGTSGDNAFKFDPKVVEDRSVWKSGPVHLMWDDERKVWAGGLQIVGGKLKTDITAGSLTQPTTFEVEVQRKTSSTKGKELENKGETITCYNRDASLEQKVNDEEGANQNIWIMAVRLNYEWTPLWVGCPEDDTEADATS